MEPADKLAFAVSDRIQDIEISPAIVPLGLMSDFQKEVADFLRGSDREIDPGQVLVSVEKGSLELVASGLLLATSLWADVERLRNPLQWGTLDPKRAAVVGRWQDAARKNPNRRYRLADSTRQFAVEVTKDTDFRIVVDAVWVRVEKYLNGQVVDWGGTTRTNVHLRLDDGKLVTIDASQQQLANEEKNRLYRPAVLRVAAEENLKTGELRNHSLLAFEAEPVDWNEDELTRLVEKGTQAWADTAPGWLEDLRGGHE